MTENNLGLIGKIADIAASPIVQGSDTFIVTQLIYKGGTDPYPFSGFVEATAYFEKTDGTALEVEGALEIDYLGLVRFELTAAQTADLAVGDEQSFQVNYEDDRGVTIILFEGKLQIVEALF